jgi:hypothetical protein
LAIDGGCADHPERPVFVGLNCLAKLRAGLILDLSHSLAAAAAALSEDAAQDREVFSFDQYRQNSRPGVEHLCWGHMRNQHEAKFEVTVSIHGFEKRWKDD